MRKLVLAFGVILGLSAVPGVANAAPIGINTCVVNDIAECDIFANYDDGVSTLGAAEGNVGGYLVGYTFLLNAGADLSTFEADDVAHILVIRDSLFELFSNTIASFFVFTNVFNAASTGADIDGTTVTAGQLAGCPPIPGGVPVIDGVGYCTSADIVTLDNVVWAIAGIGGGNDLLRIHTALPIDTDPAAVPEPGTLSLLALGGGAAAAAVLRRSAAKK